MLDTNREVKFGFEGVENEIDFIHDKHTLTEQTKDLGQDVPLLNVLRLLRQGSIANKLIQLKELKHNRLEGGEGREGREGSKKKNESVRGEGERTMKEK